MLVRIGGWAVIVFWTASMSWLVWHDVWPVLTAGQPPRMVQTKVAPTGIVSYHAGIFNKYGHRIGTAWTTYYPIGEAVRREDVVHVESFVGLPPTLLEINSDFDAHGRLDQFTLQGLSGGTSIKVTGERFASMYGFKIDVGTIHERLRLGADDAGLIGDVFRPFATLPGLKVGQSWRMQVINPIAIITGFGDRFVPMLVRVTRKESVTTADGRTVDCLVVEAPNATAWVDDTGKVIIQQVELPVGGMLTIRDEPYNEAQKQKAKAQFTQEENP